MSSSYWILPVIGIKKHKLLVLQKNTQHTFNKLQILSDTTPTNCVQFISSK